MGPVTGDEVSGYASAHSLFIEQGSGPTLLTGGGFGVEGSVLMTMVEVVAIAVLVRQNAKMRGRQAG